MRNGDEHMGEMKEYSVGDLVVNFDRMRKPLSSIERENKKGIYPYYGATCIFDYVDDYIFDGDYILLGEDGTVINADGSPVLQRISGKNWVNNHAHVLQNTDLIDYDYLYYALKNSNFRGAVTGAVQPKVSQANMNAVKICIHTDKQEQKKVARYLLAIDEKIKNNEEIKANLMEQANALFQAWFVDFEPFGGERPNDWIEGTLSDIVDFSNGYAFKSKELLDAPDPERECYHVFKQGHINRGGGFNINGTKSWYPKDLADKLQKYVLRKGDILMAMTDMKDNVAILGCTAVMEIDGEYIVNQRVGLLRPNGKYGIQYPFISLLTNSYDFLKDLRSRANSGVQVNLSSNEIKQSVLYIAPEEINVDFNSIVQPLFELMISKDHENIKLAQLRDSLLHRLMSGTIDVTEV